MVRKTKKNIEKTNQKNKHPKQKIKKQKNEKINNKIQKLKIMLKERKSNQNIVQTRRNKNKLKIRKIFFLKKKFFSLFLIFCNLCDVLGFWSTKTMLYPEKSFLCPKSFLYPQKSFFPKKKFFISQNKHHLRGTLYPKKKHFVPPKKVAPT